MVWNQRSFRLMPLLLFLLLALPGSVSGDIVGAHGLAMTGTPKYPAGFNHFDYVNPQAPKGGTVHLDARGTFDSLNPFIIKGAPAAGIGLIYDTLTTQSLDESFSQYGRLANRIDMPADRRWIVYHLHPKARFHDGKPVTAEDVVFSFNILREKGDPLYGKYWADVVKVEALDPLSVRFDLGDGQNPELPLIIGQLTVMPKHHWEGRDFSKPGLEIPIGSGPYRIADVKPGSSITYRRDPDYWGRDIPVNRGQYNFGTIVYDYYRDPTVSLHAFKAGEYDFRQENISKAWATAYVGPAFDDGMVVTLEIPNDVNQGMQAFVFNTRRSFFKDPRLRQALAYAFDFEWTNKNLFYGQYIRSTSFFSNSELAATGLPSDGELKILEPLKAELPPDVFTKAYTPPTTDGSGNIRRSLRTALGLLKSAGWEVKGKQLTHLKSGERLAFEILLYDPTFERVVLPFKKNLARLGVEMSIRVVDTAQYINRLREYDYDMIITTYGQSESPGNEQREFWSTAAADIPGTRNYAGVRSAAIDALVEKVIEAPTRQDLVLRTRALDRALLWGHYVIPQWHINAYRVAYWDFFERPQQTPRYSLGFNTWWVNPEKATRVQRYRKQSVPKGS
ncbi:MAG: extracellular solute-binding protein [Desulfosarcinaceae bacterium]|nr:extracellular solute-binding protein [Desulfosarcinaceae bacterium]